VLQELPYNLLQAVLFSCIAYWVSLSMVLQNDGAAPQPIPQYQRSILL
jgi:hypothetical protein